MHSHGPRASCLAGVVPVNARQMVLGITILALLSLEAPVRGEDLAGQPLGEAVAPATPTTPGQRLPTFSGTQNLQGSIQEVLTVLRDVPSISQWAYGISRAQLVKRVSANVDLIYLYSHTPWPVHDRDMTVRREIVELETGIAYRIVLSCQSGIRAPRDGIVRVSECHSEFRLQRLDDRTTIVEYSASLDPAGHIPNWTKSWMARTVPGRTLAALQERVTRLTGSRSR